MSSTVETVTEIRAFHVDVWASTGATDRRDEQAS